MKLAHLSLFFVLTLLLLLSPGTSVRAQCNITTILPCDDGDPCTINDMETVDDVDGSICVPCAGTLGNCAAGATSVVACDDGDPSTINDAQTILDCDGTICIPCMGTFATCDNGTTTTQPCDDFDPCTDNDIETVLDADGSICVPCAGTPVDCAAGSTSVVACDDGNPSTINDAETILDCDGTICVPCAGTIATCDNGATTIRPCDDGDPCTDSDMETVLDADGTICVPCVGTRLDCAAGATSVVACDDGDPSTINDAETILDCDGTICVPCAGTLIEPICDNPIAEVDLQANAVRARLTTSGMLWNGNYAVTANEGSPDINPVNAIFNGALWLGGKDGDGSLFLRAPQFGSGDNAAYLPGPLFAGQTNPETCARWDRFFEVKINDVRLHTENFRSTEASGNLPVPVNQIPVSLLGWPGMGNPHFESVHGFPLHETSDGLAPFWDEDTDGIYDPTNGDYPLFCGDEAIWFVFNTGNLVGDGVAGQAPFQIEVMAYAIEADNEDLHRTTFYDYTIKYQGQETLFDFYAGHSIDSDLGCSDNDRADSDPDRGLFYVYNDHPSEGPCANGEAGYGVTAPVNVFQVLGASFSIANGEDTTGMQHYNTFYNAAAGGGIPPATTDPTTAIESYNYLSGKWKDGSPITRGGNGYNSGDGEVTNFAHDGVESNDIPWLSCTTGNPATDIRSVYSIGPNELQPGAVSRFTLAVTTLFNVDYSALTCPDRQSVLDRADAIRDIYDNGCSRAGLSTSLTAEPASAIQLMVFPNPVSNVLNFRLPNDQRAERLELLDLNGRVVTTIVPMQSEFKIKLKDYGIVAGSYFYRLYTTSERLVTGKVIVRR